MGKTFLRETSKILQAKRQEKRWKKAVLPLVLTVIMLTCSLLTYPALTMEKSTICGTEEHTHTQECYQRELICGQEVREAAPEKSETILNCQKNIHQHTAECFDEKGQALCGQEAHTHSDECWQTVYTPTVEGHEHTEACYQEVQICQKAEHVHSEGCYSQQEKIVTSGTETQPGTAVSSGTETQPGTTVTSGTETQPGTTAAPELTVTPETTVVPKPTVAPAEEGAVYSMTINYYVQEISDTPEFKLDHKDTFTVDKEKWYTTSENYCDIKGFTPIFEKAEDADGTKSKIDENSSETADFGKVEKYVLSESIQTLKASHSVGALFAQDEEGFYVDLYYARNQYDLIFTLNDGNADIEYKTADGTGIYYEADISNAAPSSYIKGETQKKESSGETYIFDGWYENEECTGDAYSFDGKTMPADNLHFYAKWSPITYHVRYVDASGETVIQEDLDNYADQSNVTILSVPETYEIPNGQEFVGWLDECTQKVYVPGDVLVMNAEYTNVIDEKQYYILKAQYTALNTTYLKYDANGGNGTLTDIGDGNLTNMQSEIPSNSSLKFSSGEGFSKTGYKLIAWNTEADADGSDSYVATRYSLDGTYAVDEINGNILYAEWTPVYIDISFKNNGESSDGTAEKPLAGAEFQLQSNDRIVADTTSDANGNVIFESVLAPTDDAALIVKQIKTPKGYVLDTESYEVSYETEKAELDTNGEYHVKGTIHNAFPVLNELKRTSITLTTTDEIGNPLSGAEFKLERLVNNAWVQVGNLLSVDINGLTVENLIDGSYRLTETKAPEYYLLLSDALSFEIADGKIVTITDNEDIVIENMSIMIKSSADPACVVPYLPSTGGIGTLPYILSGLLLVMAALMYGLVLQRRKKAVRTRHK